MSFRKQKFDFFSGKGHARYPYSARSRSTVTRAPLKPSLHDTTAVVKPVVKPVVQPGLTAGLTTGCQTCLTTGLTTAGCVV